MPEPGPLAPLAESLFPLLHDLTAGLLLRPLPLPLDDPGYAPLSRAGIDELCRELDDLLQNALPALRETLEEMAGADPDDLEELAEELAAPALDMVDMARRIWEAPLPPEAESLRPLLATLAEAPAAQLLDWLHRLLHALVDPWAVAGDPDNPAPDFTLPVPDEPLREALAVWRRAHPGIVPEDVLL